MNRVLVFGYQGQLASELRLLKGNDPLYTFVPKEQIQIENSEGLQSLFRATKPDFVINCTAFTAVDKAETEVSECFRVNRDFVKNLALASQDFKYHLIHFSTDYVFNGQSTTPYKETDPVDPVNTYGRSKLEGEALIQALAYSATIVRTSWVYSKFGHNFVKTMIRLAEQNSDLRVVADQHGCPTWAHELAALASGSLLQKTEQVDLFHFSGEEQTTWSDFAGEIFRVWGKSKSIVPIATDQFPTPAKRPQYSVLSKDKIKRRLGVEVPSWKDSLLKCYSSWG